MSSQDRNDEDEPQRRVKVQTGQEHVFRLLPLRIHYQLDIDPPSAKDDTITLESEDGSYRHTIAVKDLVEFEEDWVELRFPWPKSGNTFTLTQDPGDGEEPICIFEDMSLRDLNDEEEMD